MSEITTLKKAKKLTGGGITNQNSKMPEYTYDLSAWDCNTGSKLREVEGSSCSDCYAMKGNYLRYKNGSVGVSHKKHLASIYNKLWSEAIAYQIKHYKIKHFRFHSSGDIQSYQHALNIIEVARLCPDTNFWIPTREMGVMGELKKNNIDIPSNCVFRLSAPLVNGKLNTNIFNTTSSVIDNEVFFGDSWRCLALKQGGQCLDCRACWSKDVKDVAYTRH